LHIRPAFLVKEGVAREATTAASDNESRLQGHHRMLGGGVSRRSNFLRCVNPFASPPVPIRRLRQIEVIFLAEPTIQTTWTLNMFAGGDVGVALINLGYRRPLRSRASPRSRFISLAWTMRFSVARIGLLGAVDIGSTTVEVIQCIFCGLFASWLFRIVCSMSMPAVFATFPCPWNVAVG
jgi:hypothetical protein